MKQRECCVQADQTDSKTATLPMVAGVSVSVQTGEVVVHTVPHPDDKRAGIKAVLAVYSHNAALQASANFCGTLHTFQVFLPTELFWLSV